MLMGVVAYQSVDQMLSCCAAFLADASNLQAVQKVLQSDAVSPEQVGLV
jgi:hypothetical protein